MHKLIKSKLDINNTLQENMCIVTKKLVTI